ncbi:MarR family protein [Haloactinopolyspora alba]|uniref:MarR family protein n=1 Tax=Haloactinopolyspora alba TaxID=648780 RepID=A0A2P8E7C8_9ACTN|nr:MarR family transcriptional regulator [Haloactinopolyspora alba]PSL05361.1 MarR family protein [Haloactinopolyspora alba]
MPDGQHEAAVRRFVEQFGMLLTDSGIPRMPARVFAYVLADDAETYTAGDLASGLQVSPAAVSGAVRQLVQMGLLARERAPGSRVDHYRVYDDDVWSAISAKQLLVLGRYEEVLTEGVELLDLDRPGGRRVYETREFYRFMGSELAGVIRRWSEYRRDLFADDDRDALT